MEENVETSSGILVTTFALGGASFGVDARLVQEVVKVGDLTPVHDAPPEVVGIRNLRGRIVTVVDLAVHLGLGTITPGPENRLLIMERQGEYFGFLVDTVTDAVHLEEGQLTTPPASLDPSLARRLQGVLRETDRLTAILDPKAMFSWGEA